MRDTAVAGLQERIAPPFVQKSAQQRRCRGVEPATRVISCNESMADVAELKQSAAAKRERAHNERTRLLKMAEAESVAAREAGELEARVRQQCEERATRRGAELVRREAEALVRAAEQRAVEAERRAAASEARAAQLQSQLEEMRRAPPSGGASPWQGWIARRRPERTASGSTSSGASAADMTDTGGDGSGRRRRIIGWRCRVRRSSRSRAHARARARAHARARRVRVSEA